MNKQEILIEAYEYVKELLKDDFTGHDILHIDRVLKNARNIYKNIDCDKFIIDDCYVFIVKRNGNVYVNFIIATRCRSRRNRNFISYKSVEFLIFQT